LLQRRYKQNQSIIQKIDYLSNVEIHIDTVKEIYHKDGRLEKKNGVWQYEYWLKDHLGNLRSAFRGINNDSYISQNEIITRNDYYAFGLEMAGSHLLNGNRFAYGGKERLEQMNLGLLDFGARNLDKALGRWKQVDEMASKMPKWSNYSYSFNNPIRFIDEDGNIPTPYEAALIAKHVYGDNIQLAGGWKQSSQTFGLKLGATASGLKFQIYERTIDNVTEYVYAFAGSETGKDWFQNLIQPFGLSGEFNEAVSNSRALSGRLRASELTYVGHSQGGAEAAASSYATKRKAITFNAAGVGKLTLKDNNILTNKGSINEKILAFTLNSDPLNFLQNKNGIHDINFGLMPDVDGIRIHITPSNNASLFNGHSIDNIIKEIKRIFFNN
jgi:RHS repeat-associated protein